jgi:elongation factor 1-beta
MAQAIVSLKIMPDSPEADLAKIEEGIKKSIIEFAGEGEIKVEEQPVAFGLKSINIIFVMDESIGSTESLETAIADIENVSSVEVTDVRRAIG